MIYAHPSELDERLLKSFTKRVMEAGVAFESTLVLRAIKGGGSK